MGDTIASLERPRLLDRLRSREVWDLVVIGGGATGLGTAVDAASRGYRVVVLDANDFAHGTSSRSTKLVHGGVRYLAQGNLPLVREALRERGLLLRNAPHLVHVRQFIVPAYRYWRLPYYGAGLWLYDRLAGRLNLGRSRWIGRSDALAKAATLRADGLKGAILYTDGQFDDARLAISMARTLADLSGLPLNHLPVTAILKQNGRVSGVEAHDDETGESFTIQARAVVNATGVFADAVRALDDPSARPLIAPSQGIHLVLDRAFLPGETAIMIPKTDDGRVLFAIPWHRRVLLGTTDTPIRSVSSEPRPLDQEIDYLLDYGRRYLSRPPERSDIKSVFAGLRPLVAPPSSTERGKATSKLSREHTVLVSESGLITVTGGKWTTYRSMGEDAVNQAALVGDLPRRPSRTSDLKLHGWYQPNGTIDPEDHFQLYGSDLPTIQGWIARDQSLGAPIHGDLPYTAAEIVWAARFEFARTVEDALARRTRALFLDARASIESASLVARILAEELGRDQTWQGDQVARFTALARGYLPGGA